MNIPTIIALLLVLYVFKKMGKSKNVIVFLIMKKKVDIATPHFVYQALNQRDSKIILVNVLSDKMEIKLH